MGGLSLKIQSLADDPLFTKLADMLEAKAENRSKIMSKPTYSMSETG